MLIYVLSTLIGALSGALINFCIAKMPREKQLLKQQPALVIVLTVIAAIASVTAFPLSAYPITTVLVFAFCAVMVAVTFIDFEFKIIPDKITIPGIIIGLVLSVVSQFFHSLLPPFTQGIVDSLIGLAVGAGLPLLFIYLYYLLTKRVGFGMGDVKLLGMFGACLGWWPILPIFFISSILGSIFGIAYILVTKKDRRAEIPFGPYLAVGAIIYLFVFQHGISM